MAGASIAVVIATLAAASVRAAEEEPAALLVGGQGRVEVVSARTRTAQPARFGTSVHRGDVIRVGPRGSATLFFSDGNIVDLGENSTVTIGRRRPPRPAGGPVAGLPPPLARFIMSGSHETGRKVLSPMRSGDQAPLLLSPRGAILEPRPALRWRAASGAERYRVTLADSTGPLWSGEAADTSLVLPLERPLAHGGYLWSVQAISAAGPLRREEATFEVLGAGEASAIRAQLERIADVAGGRENETTLYLSGCYLFARGLYEAAAERFEALCRAAPDPGARRALANTWETMGLGDRARAERARADEAVERR